MTKEEFNQLTDKIGDWFAHLKLNSFRKTFDGDIYPSSKLVTQYNLFLDTLKNSFVTEPSLPAGLDEAADAYSTPEERCEGQTYNSEGYYCIYTELKEAFKSGAEWMARKIDEDSFEEVAQELYQDDEGAHCVVSVGTDYKPGDILIVYTKKK